MLSVAPFFGSSHEGLTVDPPIQLGLYTWLRGDYGINNTTALDAWQSRGSLETLFGNTGANRPTFIATNPALNGRPTVRFASASLQFLASADAALANALDGSQPYTTFVVVDRVTALSLETLWALGVSGNSTQSIIHRLGMGPGNDNIFRDDGPGNTQNGGSQTDGGQPTLYVATYSGSSYSVWQNGVLSVNNSTNTRIPTCDRAYVGAYRFAGGYGNHLNGDIAEILIYGAVLSAPDIAITTAYVKARYALAALP